MSELVEYIARWIVFICSHVKNSRMPMADCGEPVWTFSWVITSRGEEEKSSITKCIVQTSFLSLGMHLSLGILGRKHTCLVPLNLCLLLNFQQCLERCIRCLTHEQRRSEKSIVKFSLESRRYRGDLPRHGPWLHNAK